MEEQERQIPWDAVLGLVLRRKRLIGTVVVIGVSLAALYAWLQPPVYRATSTLALTSERARIAVSPDANSGPTVDRMTEQDLISEAQLLRSYYLIREVLTPHRDTLPSDEPHGIQRLLVPVSRLFGLPSRLYQRLHHMQPLSQFDQWVFATAAHVIVDPVPKSNLIEVSYDSSNPQWAARFVNELTEHHVARNARLNQKSEPRRFFLQQRELLNQKVTHAEKALRDFSRENGIDVDPEQRKAMHAQIGALEKSLGEAETALAEGGARAGFLTSDLPNHPRLLPVAPRAAQSDPLFVLRTRVVELELQRSQLLAQYAPTSIRIRDLDRQIADAKSLLAREEKNPSANGGLNPTHQALDLQLAQTRAQDAALNARITALRQHLSDARGRLEHLEQTAAQQDRLEQELNAARAAYAIYLKKEEEARFSTALDESKIVNVAVVEPAQVPVAPRPGRTWLTLAFGVIASLALGGALAFVRDRMDPAVKSVLEAERLTGVPVLADIPL